jgi:DNA-binding response OmpR family regulator
MNAFGSDEERLVLIADDDADIRGLVALRLERSGFTVECAEDGESALSSARAMRPAVVVLDVAMPGLTGLEVLAALKGDPDTAQLPVMLLTARAAPTDVEHGLGAGADEYVTKPFSPQELAARVEALFARTWAAAAAA